MIPVNNNDFNSATNDAKYSFSRAFPSPHQIAITNGRIFGRSIFLQRGKTINNLFQ